MEIIWFVRGWNQVVDSFVLSINEVKSFCILILNQLNVYMSKRIDISSGKYIPIWINIFGLSKYCYRRYVILRFVRYGQKQLHQWIIIICLSNSDYCSCWGIFCSYHIIYNISHTFMQILNNFVFFFSNILLFSIWTLMDFVWLVY